MRKSVRLALLVVLAGCGGGGGGGGGNPSQSNSQSPTFGGLTGTLSASASALPANGARAAPTFESIGLYWKPPTNPGDGCPVIFRRVGDSNWRQGLDMWYDPNNGECRGS